MHTHYPIKMIEKGQMLICEEPKAVYCLEDVGACVGVFLYHPTKKIGGVMYGLLPSSSTMKSASSLSHYAFLDKGSQLFVNQLSSKLRCNKKELKAVVVGGANMQTHNPFLRIGDQNVMTVRTVLASEKIPLAGEAVGGSHNRLVHFLVDAGCVRVREYHTTSDILFFNP
jgi:chemotaxis protein CheD